MQNHALDGAAHAYVRQQKFLENCIRRPIFSVSAEFGDEASVQYQLASHNNP